MVRSLTVVYSIQKKTSRKGAKEGSYERKENIENLLEINYCENEVKKLDTIKKRIKDTEDKKAEGHRIRAKIPKFEETEPNIIYYAKLETSKSEKNIIYSLYEKNGDISAGTDEVLATSKEFYSELYKKEGADTTLHCKTKSLNP